MNSPGNPSLESAHATLDKQFGDLRIRHRHPRNGPLKLKLEERFLCFRFLNSSELIFKISRLSTEDRETLVSLRHFFKIKKTLLVPQPPLRNNFLNEEQLLKIESLDFIARFCHVKLCFLDQDITPLLILIRRIRRIAPEKLTSFELSLQICNCSVAKTYQTLSDLVPDICFEEVVLKYTSVQRTEQAFTNPIKTRSLKILNCSSLALRFEEDDSTTESMILTKCSIRSLELSSLSHLLELSLNECTFSSIAIISERNRLRTRKVKAAPAEKAKPYFLREQMAHIQTLNLSGETAKYLQTQDIAGLRNLRTLNIEYHVPACSSHRPLSTVFQILSRINTGLRGHVLEQLTFDTNIMNLSQLLTIRFLNRIRRSNFTTRHLDDEENFESDKETMDLTAYQQPLKSKIKDSKVVIQHTELGHSLTVVKE